jgi:signal transduction histidine kinase/DNA-binding response OmpR family regulator/ligand-binding sensor domain-containing protein
MVKTRNLNVAQGLSHNQINCFHQDQNGAIWIGTQYGLNRFDGQQFKWFTREESGLHSNLINEIYQDQEGWLWLVHSELRYGEATYFSIDLFHPYTYQALAFKDRFPKNNPFQIAELQAIHQMPGGKLLFSLKNGTHFLFSGGKTFEKLPFEPGFTPHLAIEGNLVWGSSQNKLLLQNLSGKIIRSYPLEQGLIVWQLTQDALGRLWAVMGKRHPEKPWGFTEARIFVFSGEIRSELSLPESDANPYETHLLPFDQEKAMVILRKKEMFEIDKDLKIIFHDPSLLGEQPYQQYASSMVDRTGTLWYGYLKGIWMMEIQQSRFHQYLKGSDGSTFPARGLAEYGRFLFVNATGSLKGIFLDLKTEKWRTYSEINARFATNNCFPMYLNAAGELWTASDRLSRFDSLGHLITDMVVRTGNGSRIWSFFQDRSKTWWMGVDRGFIYHFNPSQNEKPQIFDAYNGFNDLQKAEKWHFLENERGIWISAQNGLYLLDKQKGIVARYCDQEEGAHYLPALQFYYSYQDKEGNLWLATGDAGLLKIGFDAAANPVILQHITRANGLPSNELYAIFEDAFHHLWISSANGLIQFSKETGEIRVYFETQGITNNEFNKLSAFQSPSGRIYFGGQNGVTAFDPKDFKVQTPYDPPLIFTEASLFSGSKKRLIIITDDLIRDQRITFNPGDKFINLQFLLQDYFNSDKVRYSYQIEGLDSKWTELNTNTLQLSGLPYGTHTLHIRGKGPDNRISAHQVDLEIWVKRPFFLQGWFIALFILAIGVSTWKWYLWRIQSFQLQQQLLEKMVADRTKKIQEDKLLIEGQAEQLKELDEIKSRFFANISHELRTPLTLILGPLQSVLKRNHLDNRDHTLLHLMQQNAEQLLKRINELLDLSSLDANKLKILERAVVLYPFIKKILDSFESAAHLRKIHLVLDYQLENHLQLLLDTDKVERILSNFLSNALKFTPEKGKIMATVLRKGNLLEISVADTGSGIPQHEIEKIFDRFYQSENNAQSGGTGIGLALCRELAKHMNGQVWAESQLDQGSIFYLQLPLVEYIGQVLPESEPKNSLDPPAYLTNKGAKATILVAEDNLGLLEYIQTLLEDYHVLTAQNGQLALGQLTEYTRIGKPVNLIISDIMMPVMDGFELLKTLKEHDDYRHIPVIMLTAHQKSDVKLEALRIGVDDYMVKPFQEAELLARVTNLINNSNRRMEVILTKLGESGSDQKPLNKTVITAADSRWLSEIEKIILLNIGDTAFKLSQVADEMAMSPRRLQQKIKEITGLTPKDYQREIQLEYARRILEAGEVQSISEISYKVGIKDAHYFSTLFQNRYGKKPNDYL